MCANAAPCFSLVVGSIGGTKLGPKFVDHTFSILRALLAEIDGVEALALMLGN